MRHTKALIAILVFAAAANSGCYATYGLLGWAGEKIPESAAGGTHALADGSTRVVFQVKNNRERPDGDYYFDVPVNWQSLQRTGSIWGSDIRQVASPAVNPVPSAQSMGKANRGGPLLELHFERILSGARLAWEPAFGVARTYDDRGPVAAVFGHCPHTKQWVLLGGIRLDEGKAKLERQGAALIALPVAVAMDAVAFTLCVIAVGAGGGGSGGEFETPRFMWRIPKLVQQLTHTDARERRAAIRSLKRFGAFAKVAVPRLRMLLTDPDPDNRLLASGLIAELCPNDPTWSLTSMADLLGSPDVNVRRRAALRISREGGAATPEARLGACINALNDPDPHVRANIAATLGRMGAVAFPAVDGLRRLLRDPSWRVRRNATYAIRRIERAQRVGG